MRKEIVCLAKKNIPGVSRYRNTSHYSFIRFLSYHICIGIGVYFCFCQEPPSEPKLLLRIVYYTTNTSYADKIYKGGINNSRVDVDSACPLMYTAGIADGRNFSPFGKCWYPMKNHL